MCIWVQGYRDWFDGTQYVMHGTDPWAGIGRTLTLTSLGSRVQPAQNAVKKSFVLSPSGDLDTYPNLRFGVTKKCIKEDLAIE